LRYDAGMYELFDHTADLGLRATAGDLDTLFAEAARALTAAIVENPADVRPVQTFELNLSGAERDYLLFDWLKELLYRFDTEHFLMADCTVQVRDDGLSATVRGEAHDPQRHTLCHEVKAITYHELKVEKTADGWLAEVIVDI
jgi:SHS2 domain-containing protein